MPPLPTHNGACYSTRRSVDRRKEIILPRRFRGEIPRTLSRVAQHPYASLRVDDFVRRVLTNRFRYRIDFTFDENSVLVLAIKGGSGMEGPHR